MTVLEKTISDLHKYTNYPYPLCNIASDAIICLEEYAKYIAANEPKLVTNIHKQYNNVLNPNAPWVGKCPKCNKKIEGRNLTRFCKFCGQAVKWE